MFPGQGAQYLGMCSDAINKFDYVKDLWEKSSDAIKVDLIKMVKDGPKELLSLTENTQPLLLVSAVSYAKIIENEVGIKGSVFAGHSLGEYSALVASGRIDLSDAVNIVRKRGQFMQSAVPVGMGAMAAIIGLDKAKIDSMCKNISSDGKNIVEIANYNGHVQTVISGLTESVGLAMSVLMEMGGKAIKLPVSAPFHCSLMKKAAEDLKEYIDRLEVKNNSSIILPNIDPKFYTEYNKEFLLQQIYSVVKWTDTIQEAYNNGVKTFIDIGPSKTLAGIAKKMFEKQVDEQLKIVNFDSSNGGNIEEDIKAFGNNLFLKS